MTTTLLCACSATLLAAAHEVASDSAFSSNEPMVLKGLSGRAVGVAFFPDGKRLMAAAVNSNIKVWDLAPGSPTASYGARDGYFARMALAPTGSLLAVALASRAPRRLKRLTGYMGRTYDVACSPNDDILLVGADQADEARYHDDADTALALYGTVENKPVAILQERPLNVTAVAFSRDGRRVASAHSDAVVRLWEAKTQKCVALLQYPKDCRVTCLAFSSDGHRLAAGAGDRINNRSWRREGQVFVWKLAPANAVQ